MWTSTKPERLSPSAAESARTAEKQFDSMGVGEAEASSHHPSIELSYRIAANPSHLDSRIGSDATHQHVSDASQSLQATILGAVTRNVELLSDL
jgi:hypothetical protein